MKAIIMAGGEGTRLRPLTCGRPKPMMPVVNRPMMEHIVALLKKHGIYEIGVTLQYLPEAIRGYFGHGGDFGVHMRYYVEEVPLGTAGSVKNAQEFLDETFVVISGDALTDLDLTQALEFHRQKGAIATLVLTPVAIPLEYGVVITDRDGRITQFLEKPGWGEVFSDTVNTGIYILEPEVLEFFAAGQKFDFSKDLFPLLLKNKQPLFGVSLTGYWCDIGNLQQYVQAHHDCLTGKVAVSIPGTQVAPGIWVGQNSDIHPAASLNGPLLIGDNCRVGAGAVIDAYTVVGNGCIVQEQATIKRSVLWDNVFLGARSAVRGAVIGSQVKINTNSSVYEGSVVGSRSVIRERALVKPDVKLWPGKVVESGATVAGSLVWGTGQTRHLFGVAGVSGLANIDITPEFAGRLGAALGSTLSVGRRVGVSGDGRAASDMIKQALLCGLQSAGIQVVDFGTGIMPMHRYAVKNNGCQGGIHVQINSRQPDKINLIFTDEKGGNISRSQERKIENTLAREDFRRVEAQSLLPVISVQDAADTYLNNLLSNINEDILRQAGFHLVLQYDRSRLEPYVSKALTALGITFDVYEAAPDSLPDSSRLQRQLAAAVTGRGGTAGALLEPGGDQLILVDGGGRVVSEEMLTALISLIILKEQAGPVIVPVTAPGAIDELASRYQGMVVRTKTSQQDFLDKLINYHIQSGGAVWHHFMNFDALLALLKILEFCARENVTLAHLVEEIPGFFINKKEVAVPWEAKGRVIRRLIEEPGGRLELLDGVKVYHPQGWALVLPDPEEPVCRIFSEGATMEIAEELTAFYSDKIKQITAH
ncbi:mannose-1-phosphate guanyltransferase [Desulfotomaculum varum]